MGDKYLNKVDGITRISTIWMEVRWKLISVWVFYFFTLTSGLLPFNLLEWLEWHWMLTYEKTNMHAVYLVGAPNSMLAICSWVLPVHFFQLLEMKFIGGWECQNAGTWLFTLHFHAGRIPFVYILLLQGICATWERKSENHIKTFACASLSVNTKSCGMWSTKSFDVQWQKNMICDVGDVGLGIDVAKPGGGGI